MDLETVYIRTPKGDEALGSNLLSLESHDILSRIDGKTSIGKMMRDATFWTEQTFDATLSELLEGGYIRLFEAVEENVPEPDAEVPEEEAQPSIGKSKFARSKRTLIASVLFLDIVEYTKKSVSDQFRMKEDFNKLVYELVQKIPEDDRIIVDTGDGAALGFLADPEEVLFIAIRLRDALEANEHRDHPDLHVRMGINLGPVKLVTDMNGRENLIGDGVNDANRVMSFAKGDQVLVSRSFYDVVSRLSSEHFGLFKYLGIHKDKHRREHEIYEVAGGNKAPREEEQVREKTEEEIKAERLEKMKAKLEAAAKAEAETKAAQEIQEKAREAAQAEMRRKAEARLAAEKARAASLPKKGVGIGKAIAIVLVLLLVVVAAVLPFVPLQFLAQSAATKIANGTQETVTIGSASFSLFPTPRINLKEVVLGENLKIAKAAEILGSDTYSVDGVTADQTVLSRLSGWGILAKKIELRNVVLSLDGRALPAFGGQIDLGQDGSFRHASIISEGMQAEISPGDSGFSIDLSAKNWKIPFGPQCPWSEIRASALASPNEVKITSFDASGYGGNWTGSGSISWGRFWRADGRIRGKNFDVGALMPYFSADAKVGGTLEFDAEAAATSATFTGLFDAPRVGAAFKILDGSVGNVDIAQAIRSPSPDGTRGGETKFDSLSGMFAASAMDYRYSQLKLESGILKAAGEFDLREGKLSGRMAVSLDQLRSPLSLGGTLADPVIR